MTLELFGAELNIWGLYCAIGALCAFAAMGVICRSGGMKSGSAPVLGVASLICGMICSRLVYCLFTTLTSEQMSLDSWIKVSEGGWSLFGMIGGTMLAAWISARIVGEKPGRMLDAVSVAVSLMIAAERIGEESLQSFFNETSDVFNLSRQINSEGFLTIVNNGKIYLATYRIDAFLAMILFLFLTFSLLSKRRRDGDLWILFLLLCGAGGVLGESLRKDQYLEYSFVRIQQVLAAVMLAAGTALAGYRAGKASKDMRNSALLTMLFTVAECIGLEFLIDRSDAVHSTLYGIMIGALSIPAVQGVMLVAAGREQREFAGEKKKTASATLGLSVSVYEMIMLLLEMGRIRYSDKFMVLTVFSTAVIIIIQSVMLYRVFRKVNTSIPADNT